MAGRAYNPDTGKRSSIFDLTSGNINSDNYGASLQGWGQTTSGNWQQNQNPLASYGLDNGPLTESPFALWQDTPTSTPTPAPAMNMADWGNMAMTGINAASGLMQAFNGWEQSKIAKKQFKQGQENFRANYNNQAQANNTYMQDRQAIRHSDSGGKAEDVASYMARNKVQGMA